MSQGPSGPCNHPVWLCRTCGTDLDTWPQVKARLALSNKDSHYFRKIEWTPEDWKDFYFTLESFKARVLERNSGKGEGNELAVG